MRFAKIGEEVYLRHQELSGEELRLYIIIVFHTWADTGVCRKTIREICQIHDLIFNHTHERYKKLRQKEWCENTPQGIRPLVGIRNPKIGLNEDVAEVQKSESVKSKNRSRKVQKSDLPSPKIGLNEDERVQKSDLHLKEGIEPLKRQSFPQSTAAEKTAADAAENNGHLSEFSIEEILRYVEICRERGERITNPHGLATAAYKSGEMDVFIRATLYPETKPATFPEDEYIEPVSEPQPLSDEARQNALVIFRGMQRENSNLESMAEFYAPADWAWLMKELEKCKAASK